MSEKLELNDTILLEVMPLIEKFDQSNIVEYAALADSLISAMTRLEGIGLAANQVGKRYRAFAMYIRGIPEVLFNPRVLDWTKGFVFVEEGCLSYPNIKQQKARAPSLEVEWKNHAGTKYQTWLDKLDAIAFQHELDHLNGKKWIEDGRNRKESIQIK